MGIVWLRKRGDEIRGVCRDRISMALKVIKTLLGLYFLIAGRKWG